MIAGETGVAHSTVTRFCVATAARGRRGPPRRETCRYEWPCPGDLLHMDVKRYPRFARPGHAVTGDRTSSYAEKVAKLGDDYFHAVVDDHSRLAYGELLDDERAATVTAFLKRALAWFARHGITTRRLMTDGAWSYTRNRSSPTCSTERDDPPHRHPALHAALEREGRALPPDHGTRVGQGPALPQPPRPQPSTATLAAHYNERRPHSSLGGRPPISRAHNLSGQDS